MIEQIDDAVGRMLAALDETGQAANTLVIFMSDHGERSATMDCPQGMPVLRSLVRVPLVFRYPGVIPPNRVDSGLVELMDIAPTLLDYAGLPIPDRMQGHSLRPLLEGRADGYQRRAFVRSEYYMPSRKPRHPTAARSRHAPRPEPIRSGVPTER